jgi:hypothetical protein
MENIIRGTTPSLVVDFTDITDFTVSEVDEIALTIKSRTVTEIHKLADVEISGNTLVYHWTQEKTLALRAGERLTIQLDVLVGEQRYRCVNERVEVVDTQYAEVLTDA